MFPFCHSQLDWESRVINKETMIQTGSPIKLGMTGRT